MEQGEIKHDVRCAKRGGVTKTTKPPVHGDEGVEKASDGKHVGGGREERIISRGRASLRWW